MADIKNTFSKGLTVLNVKTANFLEQNKIKTYITTLTTEIETLKSEVGSMAYTAWNAGENIVTEELESKFRLIQEKEQQIKEQEEEAAKLAEKEKQILGEQEAKAAANTAAASPSGAVLTCPGCGQTYETPAKFCRKCGTRMN